MNKIYNSYNLFSTLTFIILLVISQRLIAQDEFEFDEPESRNKTSIPLSGRLSFETARQLSNPNRWILLGLSLNIIIDYASNLGQIYFEGLNRYNLSYRIENDSQNTINDYEFEFIFRELFWKKAFGNYTLSAGKLIDVWGVMDLFQIVDKVPAINRADYFFADPEEVKLGQNMIKVEYFKINMDTGFLFIPYPSFDRVTYGDHPYSLVKDQMLYEKDSNREFEGGFYVNKYFSKGLLSFYSGRFNNRIPMINAEFSNKNNLRLYKIFKPYWFVGIASNFAFEPFLLKIETAYNFDRPLQSTVNNMPRGYIRQDQLELALGIDYNRGEAGIFTIEFLSSFTMQRKDKLAINRSTYFGALTWSNNYYNNKLKLSNVTFFAESLKNIVNRFQIEYYITNTFSVGAKYVLFSINDKINTYGYMQDYDRIEITLNYDFNLE